MNTRRSPLFRVLTTLFYKFFGAALVFVISIMTARYLGKAGRGNFQLAITSLGMYSPVFGSFSEYLPYGINKCKHPVQATFSTALWYYVVFTGTLFTIAILGTPWFLHGFGPFPAIESEAIWISLLVAPFAMFHVYVTRLIWGLNEIEWLNRLNTVQWILFIPSLAVGMWLTPPGGNATLYALVAWFVSYVLTACVAGFVAIRRGQVRLIPMADKKIRKEIFQFGSQLAGANLLTQVSYRIDFLLVFFLMGAEHSGVYSIAMSVAEMLTFISGSIQQVVLTRVAGLEQKDSTQLTARTFRHTGVATLVSMIGMMVAMPIVIRIAYGKDYVGAIPNFLILLPGLAVYGLSQVLTTFFTNQLGKPKINSYLAVVSIMVNVAISFLLMPKIGEAGAAWAKTSAFFVIFLITIVYFYVTTKYPVYKLFWLQPDEKEQYKSFFAKVVGKLQKKMVG